MYFVIFLLDSKIIDRILNFNLICEGTIGGETEGVPGHSQKAVSRFYRLARLHQGADISVVHKRGHVYPGVFPRENNCGPLCCCPKKDQWSHPRE